MAWWEIVISIICIVLTIWMMVHTIRKDIKKWRNQAPDGKDFIKKFSKALEDIQQLQLIYKAKGIKDNKQYIDYVPAHLNNILFKVKVLKDDTPEGLEYSTIPRYESYSVYINDEIVCRGHIFNKKHSFEFSSKRERDEVIQIILQAHETAKPDVEEYNKRKYVEWLGSKSYFEENE